MKTYTKKATLLHLLTAASGLALATSPLARAAVNILHNFTGGANDGQYPYGSLTLSGSKLYGMTSDGGAGGGSGGKHHYGAAK